MYDVTFRSVPRNHPCREKAISVCLCERVGYCVRVGGWMWVRVRWCVALLAQHARRHRISICGLSGYNTLSDVIT
jgi:hypothetical protein